MQSGHDSYIEENGGVGMLLQILVGGLVVFVIFFLVFRAIRTGNLPRHDDSQPEDGENRDQL